MVNIKYSNNKKHFGISMFGHANYAERGKDVVCAGTSAIGHSIVHIGESLQANNYVKHFKTHIESGNIVMSFDYKRKNQHIVDVCISALIYLLQVLSIQYPDNVCVEKIEHGNICA